MGEIESILKKYLEEVDKIKAVEYVLNIYEKNKDLYYIDSLLKNVLEEIGSEWLKGKISIAQVYMSGIIVEEIIEKIFPQFGSERKNKKNIAFAVFEDHHILGKKIIKSFLNINGYYIIDYPPGIDADALSDKVIEDNVDILLVSTLMLPSALKIKLLKEKLFMKNKKIFLLVGGAPFRFDKNLWREVGADATAETAEEAIEIIKKADDEI